MTIKIQQLFNMKQNCQSNIAVIHSRFINLEKENTLK